jgi:Na+-transporting NADH:ubiquinone oxidoreductase subunit NqrB
MIAIGSKFILKFNQKHFFNPANIGIILSILITGDAWISPAQWGNAAILVFIIGSLGLSVVLKVGKLDTTIAFLIAYLGLEFLRTFIYKGWPIDHFTHLLSSGSLLLFSFFMITDPVSSPNHKWARIAWAVAIGVGSFYLASFRFINGAPIWALFYFSFFTPLFDYVFRSNPFKWSDTNHSTVYTSLNQ